MCTRMISAAKAKQPGHHPKTSKYMLPAPGAFKSSGFHFEQPRNWGLEPSLAFAHHSVQEPEAVTQRAQYGLIKEYTLNHIMDPFVI